LNSNWQSFNHGYDRIRRDKEIIFFIRAIRPYPWSNFFKQHEDLTQDIIGAATAVLNGLKPAQPRNLCFGRRAAGSARSLPQTGIVTGQVTVCERQNVTGCPALKSLVINICDTV
jgi:hypothetical protein